MELILLTLLSDTASASGSLVYAVIVRVSVLEIPVFLTQTTDLPQLVG
jgi:hypothetical protein